VLTGLEFSLASRIILEDREAIGGISGSLYACDLAGGWLAGILGGIYLLPVLGVYTTCVFLACVKLSSLLLLVTLKDRPRGALGH
jgi:spermidine synthase